MSNKEEKAVQIFSQSYNCAQAVFGAMCEDDGLDQDTAFKLATGFGGGLRCGELCGTVSGAIMAIGLKCGYCIESDMEQRAFCNAKTYEFIERFRAEKGSIICRDQLGVDVYCPQDHSKPEVREAHKTVCSGLVASSVRILESMDFAK